MCDHKFIGLAAGVWCTKCHCQMTRKEYAEYLTRQAGKQKESGKTSESKEMKTTASKNKRKNKDE